MLPLFVTLKKVYDRNVVNKYLLLCVIIYYLIDYIYIYICTLEKFAHYVELHYVCCCCNCNEVKAHVLKSFIC